MNKRKIVEPEVVQFPDGLKLLYKQNDKVPLVAVHLFIPVASKYEPEEKAGLFSLMAQLLTRGTKTRDSARIAYELESTGTSLGAGSSSDYFTISGSATEDNVDKLLEILGDVLLNPVFPEQELEKERQATIAYIKSKDEHIFTIAHERLNKQMYDGHPYGRPLSGTVETVSRITQKDLVDWHKKIMNPRGSIISVSGKPALGKVEGLVRKYIASKWTSDSEPFVPGKLPAVTIGKETELKDNLHFQQAYYINGHLAPAIVSGEYPAVKVLNVIVGGGMKSRLFNALREERGIGYEVSSFYPSMEETSGFVIYAGLEAGRMAEAEGAIHKIIEDLSKAGPTQEEVDDAKRYLTGIYWMDHQTISRQAWYAGWWEIAGKGYAYDNVYPDDINKVTVAGVKDAAGSIFGSPGVTVKIFPVKK